MPFNGSGVFQRVRNWVADATAGVKIRADFHDAEDDGFAAGLTSCITRDGQSTITQNIPWNSKRITGLQDPVNAQDASTKAYADTKLSLNGDGVLNGNIKINGNLDVAGKVDAFGYRTRQGVPGPYGGNYFNFFWDGNLSAWVDGTNLGPLATQAYAESRAQAWANTRLPLAGGTITGDLVVNGRVNTQSNLYYFQWGGYIQWNGGGTYTLGGGGTIYHTGNLNLGAYVSNGRLAYANDVGILNAASGSFYEPYNGAVMTGWQWLMGGAATPAVIGFRMRYMQLYTTGWFTTGYA
jgi:hypothetical protein